MGRIAWTVVAGVLLVISCSFAGPRYEQPVGAHIRAAFGAKASRNLGVSRGHIQASLDHQDLRDGVWLHIQAYEFLDEDTDATLSLSIRNPRAGGRWKLGHSEDGATAIYAIHDITPDHTVPYWSDLKHPGTILLRRFDEKNRIIEGTFEFTGTAGAESLRVSQGSFKLRYLDVGVDGKYED